jgi:hypothetical protein
VGAEGKARRQSGQPQAAQVLAFAKSRRNNHGSHLSPLSGAGTTKWSAPRFPSQERFTMTRNSLRIETLATLIACLALETTGPSARAQEPPSPQLSDEHKLLQKGVGTWDAIVKVWPQPNAQPLESKAVEKNELLPGGLWLLSRFDGDFGGMKFHGVGQLGYDPQQKKYVGTWIDNMSPYLMVTKGDYDAATKTVTETGETRDPATHQVMKIKNVSRQIDDNTRTLEMYTPDPDGKEYKMMEITYKRRAQ